MANALGREAAAEMKAEYCWFLKTLQHTFI